MSVFMTLRVKADPERLQRAISADTARWQAINQRAKDNGCVRHRFMQSADGSEVVVADEWETSEGFQRFFEASGEIREIMGEIGVQSEPAITFWHALETPDAF